MASCAEVYTEPPDKEFYVTNESCHTYTVNVVTIPPESTQEIATCSYHSIFFVYGIHYGEVDTSYYVELEVKFDDTLVCTHWYAIIKDTVDGQQNIKHLQNPAEHNIANDEDWIRSCGKNEWNNIYTYTVTDQDYATALDMWKMR
ncbi:MAG: hypothetical protein IJ789_06640 [Bacteroidales bacterium]|nr:hypothetical protein [Bacteroidales bacterium]